MNWNLKTYSAVRQGEYLWFSNNVFNGLFRMNLITKQIQFVDFFPEESIYLYSAHKKCISYNNKLVFLPARANHIHVYDLVLEKFYTILIEGEKKDIVADAVLVDKYIYILPFYKGCDMWKLDMETLQLTRVKEFAKQCNSVGTLEDNLLLARCSLWENKIFFGFYNTDIIASWDLETETLNTYATGVDNIFFGFVEKGKCWIVTENASEIWMYDFQNKPVRYSTDVLQPYKDDSIKRHYIQIINFQGKIYALPAFADCIVRFEKDKFVEEMYIDEEKINRNVTKFFGYIELEGNLWLLPFNIHEAYIFDRDMNCIKKQEFVFTDSAGKEKIMSAVIKDKLKDQAIYETGEFKLKYYLDAVLQMD